MTLDDLEATKQLEPVKPPMALFPIQGDALKTSIRVTHRTMIQDEDGQVREHLVEIYSRKDPDFRTMNDPDFHLGHVGAD